jgi:outer membrane receptor protein involved in Fe transport
MIIRRKVERTSMLAGCALSALLATTALQPAFAQTGGAFSIPSENLGSALRAFATQSGRDVVFDPSLVRDKTAPAVNGPLDPEDALRHILLGSGLNFTVTTSGSFVIQGPPKNAEAASNDGAANPENIETVEVTGTRIRGAEVASPVITIGRGDIVRNGYATVGQALQALPQNFAGGISPTNLSSGGVSGLATFNNSSSANIHGLGANSTLTLVDGHRLAYDEESGAVDLSIFPVAAVQNIEVSTDGASAIYGSDAVGGVVNIKLRTDYSGAETSAYIGDTTDGGGFTQRYNQVFGQTWDGGHVVGAYEFSQQEAILASQRPFATIDAGDTQLSPSTKSHSVFVSAAQDIGSGLSLFAEGIYSHKNAYQNLFIIGLMGGNRTSTSEYGVTAGLNAELPYQWQATGYVTLAGNFLNGTSAHTLDSDNNRTTEYEVEAEGPLASIYAGDIRAAVGGGVRLEAFDVHGSEYISSFNVFARRTISYGYGEVYVPLVAPSLDRVGLNSLELDAAFRVEHYSDAGTSTVPKVGMIYHVVPEIELKATWSESFRAPTLNEQYSIQGAGLFPGYYFGATKPALLTFNPPTDLRPEHSTNWTASATYLPDWLTGASLTATVFDIHYRGRIARPITQITAALTNPQYAPYVTVNPSPAVQAAAIGTYPFFNLSSDPYDPAAVGALIDDNYANVAAELIKGIDLVANYTRETRVGTLGLSANGSWLNFRQQAIAESPLYQVDGTLYNPPSFKTRIEGNWSWKNLSAFVAMNYISGETDNASVPNAHVSAWVTADMGFGYALDESDSALSGVRAEFTVSNVGDTAPPFVNPDVNRIAGIAYDSANASPFGRMIAFSLTKDW